MKAIEVGHCSIFINRLDEKHSGLQTENQGNTFTTEMKLTYSYLGTGFSKKTVFEPDFLASKTSRFYVHGTKYHLK